MKAITVRGIDDEVDRRLRKRAKESGDSINTTILKLLRQSLGLNGGSAYTIHHDLDDLAGTWSRDDLEEFNKTQEGFSTIDAEMWK